MVVSNGLFDALLFGILLLGLGLDAAIPALQGTAFLLACGAAVYMAAQEWSDALSRRNLWSQEPLATALALSTGGFIYFLCRNRSDFALLVLSIGLMMASLMIAISTLGALSATVKEGSPKPLFGYFATAAGAIALGALSGLISLEAPVFAKAAVVAISFVLWKLRETLAPPRFWGIPKPNGEAATPPTEPDSLATAAKAATTVAVGAATMGAVAPTIPSNAHGRWQLIPKRGTLLDRFIPVLIIGGLMFLGVKQSSNILQSVNSPASANGDTPKN